ncbi:MAG: hypothetical protein VX764_05065 [Planctomycetota bacterium]|nr:hypothetical protein [Planctomycetota bacterium]
MTICMLIFLTILQSQSSPTEDQKVPDRLVTPLPYSWAERHEWEWIHDGIPVGTTTVQLLPPNSQQQHWTLDARLRWSREGRSIDLRQITDYQGGTLNPARTRKEGRIGALGAGERRFVTACELTGKQARIVTSSPFEGTQVDRVVPIPATTVLLETQCFEHWLVIGALLNRNKPATDSASVHHSFSALIPSEFRILQLKLTRDRQEQSGDKTLVRWKVTCPDFEAKLWTGPDGSVERYRQGPLEIRRVVPRVKVPPPSNDKPPSSGR